MFRFATGLLATGLLLTASTAKAVEPLRIGPELIAAGPWMTIGTTGQVTVSLRLIAQADPAALAAVRPYIGAVALPIEPDTTVIPPTAGPLAGQRVVSWTLPLLTRGEVRFGADAKAPAAVVPLPPDPTDDVRLAVAGGREWPTAEAITAIEADAKGAVSAVLLVGTAAAARCGSGGWEARIPLLRCLSREAAADPLNAAVLGAGDAPGTDLAWGCLGLPSLLRGPEVAVDLTARPRPWNVLLDPEATWDLGPLAKAEKGDVRRLRTAVGMARLLGIPCILGGGQAAGFVSEPLSTGATGMLQEEVGGVRYIAATPAGEGVRSLPALVATALDDAQLLGLTATAGGLRLSLGAVPGLDWPHEEPPSAEHPLPDAPSTGWGRGDPVAAAEASRVAEAPVPAELLWLPRRQLARGEWSILELSAMSEGVDPLRHLLARRLVAAIAFLGDEEHLLRRLPTWLRRDALRRWMAVTDPAETAWVRVAADTDDPVLVQALLASVEREGSPALLDVLVTRLAGQAAGRIPLDADPILQSRLASAVFDSPALSPTPLRQIARDLVEKLDPLARKPIARFLERVGRFRPAE